MKKKVIICAACIAASLLLVYNAKNIANYSQKQQQDNIVKSEVKKEKSANTKTAKVSSKTQNKIDSKDNEVSESKIPEKRINLRNNADSYSTLPLSGITEIGDVSNNVNNQLNNIIETSNGVYLLKKHGDKILIIVDNPENIRHGIDFVEISAHNGHQTKTSFGHVDKIKDTENEVWEYSSDAINPMPIRHSVYDNKGDLEFVEEWCYEDSPIKYEKKDKNGKVVALKKETIENDSNLRVENLLYDKDGKTKLNVTAVYEGEDLKRFTYYNSDNLGDSTSIINEYENGQKVKETKYNSDFKIQNIYEAQYNDGVRTNITVYDDNNEPKVKYIPLSE